MELYTFTNLQFGGIKYNYKLIPLKIVKIFEPLANYYDISRKARGLEKSTKSDKGFLQLYKELNGKWDKMKSLPVKKSKADGEKWEHHRDDYCKRRISMISRAKNYDLYDDNGLPTILHLNMLMWAASPDYKNIIKNYKKLATKIQQQIKN
jgi:hypothetical protein